MKSSKYSHSSSFFFFLTFVAFIVPHFVKADITSGLVGLYTFSEGSGSTAHDTSGSTNDGTLQNSPTWTTGQFGGGLGLNGTNQYVTILDSTSLNNQNITVSVWVKTSSYTGFASIINRRSVPGAGFTLEPNNAGGIQFGVSDGVGFSNLNTGTLTTNVWNHVVATYDGATQRLYVNGVEVASTAAAYIITGSFVTNIGNNIVDSEKFSGTLSETRIYSRALSPSDITELYNYQGVIIPTLTTSAATGITTTSATLNGSITATGGANATQSGFAYGTVANLSTVIATSTLGAQTGTASFSQTLASLSLNTTYYYRPYAINTAGTNYGTIQSFATVKAAHAHHTTPVTVTTYGTSPSITTPVTTPSTPTSTASATIVTDLPKTTAPTFTKDLHLGMTDPQVLLLQHYLNTHGYILATSGPGSPGNETTLFGTLTRLALIKLQKANEITPSVGYFGSITRGWVSGH